MKPAQYQAVSALVVTGDPVVAAAAAGVTVRTLRRWMTDSTFKEELRGAERRVVEKAARRLSTLVDKALDVLDAVMDDQNAPHHPRIRAAGVVLDTCLKWREQVELEERITSLEERVGEQK